ncbi:MAG: outer membrane beta-barrel protein [Flavobacterium sp.]
MKKLVVVLLFLSQWAFSQTEKGTFIFSGNTSAAFSKSKTKSNISDSDITSFDVNPTFGYFVKDQFFVGLTGTFEFTHTNYDQNYIDKSTLTVLMPTVGYYFPLEGSFKPFVTASFGYAHFKQIFETTTDPLFPDPAFERVQTDRYNGFACALAGGGSYFITKNFSLDAQLSYNFIQLKIKDGVFEREVSGLGLRVGFSIFL